MKLSAKELLELLSPPNGGEEVDAEVRAFELSHGLTPEFFKEMEAVAKSSDEMFALDGMARKEFMRLTGDLMELSDNLSAFLVSMTPKYRPFIARILWSITASLPIPFERELKKAEKTEEAAPQQTSNLSEEAAGGASA